MFIIVYNSLTGIIVISISKSAYSNDIKHSDEYDYVIVNDNVENCFKQIKKIISDRLKS